MVQKLPDMTPKLTPEICVHYIAVVFREWPFITERGVVIFGILHYF